MKTANRRKLLRLNRHRKRKLSSRGRRHASKAKFSRLTRKLLSDATGLSSHLVSETILNGASTYESQEAALNALFNTGLPCLPLTRPIPDKVTLSRTQAEPGIGLYDEQGLSSSYIHSNPDFRWYLKTVYAVRCPRPVTGLSKGGVELLVRTPGPRLSRFLLKLLDRRKVVLLSTTGLTWKEFNSLKCFSGLPCFTSHRLVPMCLESYMKHVLIIKHIPVSTPLTWFS